MKTTIRPEIELMHTMSTIPAKDKHEYYSLIIAIAWRRSMAVLHCSLGIRAGPYSGDGLAPAPAPAPPLE